MTKQSKIVISDTSNAPSFSSHAPITLAPSHPSTDTKNHAPLSVEALTKISHDTLNRATDANHTEQTTINNVSLAGKDIRGIALSNIFFENIDLFETKIDREQLEHLLPFAKDGKLTLRGVDLSNQDLSGKTLNRKDLGIVKLIRLSLEGLDLRQVNFNNANMQHIDLDKTNLEGANLERANLKKALLRGSNLENVDMAGVNLTEAQLQGSNLKGADLRNANIKDANLTDISL